MSLSARVATTLPITVPTLKTARRSNAIVCQSQPGDKLLPMLRSPFDLLALGPRLALGTAVSISDALAQLPSDVERLTALVQDPRPMDQKQAELLEELETRVATYVEKGTAVESDIIQAIPDPIKEALPQQLKDVLLAPRPSAADYTDDYNNGSSSSSSGGRPPEPLASWTISSMDEGDAAYPTSAMPGAMEEADVSPTVVAANQVAAELVDVQTAVMLVREQLTAMQTSTDPMKTNMLKLNLREAAEGLSRRVQQLGPTSRSSDAAVDSAVAEAEALLKEVESII